MKLPDAPEQTPEEKEKLRILKLILENQQGMAADYKQSVRRTGALVSGSMAHAYARGIQDVLKLITKDNK